MKIYILRDLDENKDVNSVEQRIQSKIKDQSIKVFVAVKALEAWYLADDDAIKSWLGIKNHELNPENIPKPWDKLKKIAKAKGVKKDLKDSDKVQVAKSITTKHGFSVVHAARHPCCPSAKVLVDYFNKSSI